MNYITPTSSYQVFINNSICSAHAALNYSTVKTNFSSLEPAPPKTIWEVLGERVIRPIINTFSPPEEITVGRLKQILLQDDKESTRKYLDTYGNRSLIETALVEVGDHLSNQTLAEVLKYYSQGNEIDQFLEEHGKKFLKNIRGRSIIDVALV